MIEEICLSITNKIRKKNPKISDEKAEILNFGLLVLLGEVPKIILILLIAWALDILFLTGVTFIAMAIYRTQAGGFHTDGHISCFLVSLITFCGTGLLAIALSNLALSMQYLTYGLIFIFNVIIITKYAPADTNKIPIINERIRKSKQIRSYLAVCALYIFAILFNNQVVSNICVLTTFVQSLSMTPVIYKLAKCEYGEISKQKFGLA